MLFPRGFGTMEEGYEALTLMQTGKSRLMPLILIDRPGGTCCKTWDRNMREQLLRNRLISEDDLNFYQIIDDATQAVTWITRFYRKFHASRFVEDLPVIRLQRQPSPTAIDALNKDFGDIIERDPIHATEPNEKRP